MLFIFLIAIIAVVIFIVAVILRQKAQKPYKILVLGPESSGKTVFLASMYYQLSTLNPETGFFLATDEEVPEQAHRLRTYREYLTNPAEPEFAESTLFHEITEWKFICKVRLADKIYPLMRFTYYDYAGERIKRLVRSC